MDELIVLPLTKIDNGGIYAIRNLANGKTYVGQSINVPKRLAKHRTLLNNSKHYSNHLQSAWNKYSEKKFSFFLLEKVEYAEHLTSREQFWCDLLQTINPKFGYNKFPSVDSPLGRKLSEETKKKIGLAGRGRIVSEETRRKLSAVNKGKKRSLETRMKISITHKNVSRPQTEQTKKKLRLAHLGKKLSSEHRRKLSESHKGYIHTDMQKAKISSALKGIKRSPATRLKMSIAQRKAKNHG